MDIEKLINSGRLRRDNPYHNESNEQNKPKYFLIFKQCIVLQQTYVFAVNILLFWNSIKRQMQGVSEIICAQRYTTVYMLRYFSKWQLMASVPQMHSLGPRLPLWAINHKLQALHSLILGARPFWTVLFVKDRALRYMSKGTKAIQKHFDGHKD